MNIVSLIEKYIELSIKRDNLNKIIEDAEKKYNYEIVEGDMAFYLKDYKIEKGYNESARRNMEIRDQAKKDLYQVEQLLTPTHETYMKSIQSLDENQLKEALIALSIKKTDIERLNEELINRRNWAESKGEESFNNHNIKEEQEYNHIYSDCYYKIKKNDQLIRYYESFVNNFNYYINKNNEYIYDVAKKL